MQIGETIQTYRTNGRSGSVFLRKHYDLIRLFILERAGSKEGITLVKLLEDSSYLADRIEFKGDIMKALLVVKEDLLARGMIKIKMNLDRSQRVFIHNRYIDSKLAK